MKVLDKKNELMGKLLWEKQLFEMSGNEVAAERIEGIIRKIMAKDVKDEESKHKATA
jgi:hypothetical protein